MLNFYHRQAAWRCRLRFWILRDEALRLEPDLVPALVLRAALIAARNDSAACASAPERLLAHHRLGVAVGELKFDPISRRIEEDQLYERGSWYFGSFEGNVSRPQQLFKLPQACA